MAGEMLAWTARLALGARPGLGTQRLRLRLFTAAGRLVRGGRRRLRLAVTWPWAQLTAAVTAVQVDVPG